MDTEAVETKQLALHPVVKALAIVALVVGLVAFVVTIINTISSIRDLADPSKKAESFLKLTEALLGWSVTGSSLVGLAGVQFKEQIAGMLGRIAQK